VGQPILAVWNGPSAIRGKFLVFAERTKPEEIRAACVSVRFRADGGLKDRILGFFVYDMLQLVSRLCGFLDAQATVTCTKPEKPLLQSGEPCSPGTS
jgi:hypothetical protein